MIPLVPSTFPQGFWKSKKFGYWISGSGGKKTFNRREQKKNHNFFFCFSNLKSFMSKSFQIWEHFSQLLFPKDSQNQKKFGHLTFRSFGKKTGSEKGWRTDRHTNISTLRIGHEGQFFENIPVVFICFFDKRTCFFLTPPLEKMQL